MTRLLALGLIAYSYFEIKSGLPQIVAHAPNRAGVAGISTALWVSLLAQLLVTGLLQAVPWIGRTFPEAVHFGMCRLSDYSPAQQERIMPLLTQMMGLMSAAFNLFSGFGIHMRIQAFLANPRQRPPAPWWAVGVVVSFAAITYYYLQRFDEVGGE